VTFIGGPQITRNHDIMAEVAGVGVPRDRAGAFSRLLSSRHHHNDNRSSPDLLNLTSKRLICPPGLPGNTSQSGGARYVLTLPPELYQQALLAIYLNAKFLGQVPMLIPNSFVNMPAIFASVLTR
jgi:hypothetical protein